MENVVYTILMLIILCLFMLVIVPQEYSLTFVSLIVIQFIMMIYIMIFFPAQNDDFCVINVDGKEKLMLYKHIIEDKTIHDKDNILYLKIK